MAGQTDGSQEFNGVRALSMRVITGNIGITTAKTTMSTVPSTNSGTERPTIVKIETVASTQAPLNTAAKEAETIVIGTYKIRAAQASANVYRNFGAIVLATSV